MQFGFWENRLKINLEIVESASVYDPVEIKDLRMKELVPKMLLRRRLTRAAKIAIFLADRVSFESGRIIYGSSFGELPATARISNNLEAKEPISPTNFQNSVYNTAVSYLSMLRNNQNEILTVSSGDNTSLNVLKTGAVKALDGDTLLLLSIETLNIEKIDEVNSCIGFLECGVAMKVRVSEKKPTIDISSLTDDKKFPLSLIHMIHIDKLFASGRENIVEIPL